MDDLALDNQLGFICFPEETEKDFVVRKRFLKNFKTTHQTFIEDEKLSNIDFFDKELDLSVNWLLIKKGKVPFWEMGRTWDVFLEDQAVSYIEYSSHFEKNLANLLRHEVIHVVRQGFREPIFEEILAFATDKSPIRKFWGPLFRRPFEVYVVLTWFLCGFIFSIFGFFVNAFFVSYVLSFFFLSFRLFFNQNAFKNGLKTIKKVFKTEDPLKIAIRLTDQEILFFSKNSSQRVLEYIKSQNSLRWTQIRSAYLL